MKSRLKNRTPGGFTPAGGSQKHSTPGDYFGTFGPKLPAFRDKAKPRVIAPKEPPNIRGRPGKKGGPGYADITISKYPEHMKDFYDEGHDGGINPYPRAEKLPKAKPPPKRDAEKKIFYPQMRLKPTPTKSIVNHNIDISVNATNWQTFTPIVYPASTLNSKLR